ncbi:MAG: AtpZ/AtpI family protein [Bacteroidota bacterium]
MENYAKYSGIAFQMIVIILLAVWGGLKLDEKYHEGEPLFIIIFSILGVFFALYVALKDFINFGK